MAFDPPSSADSQAYDSAQDADRVELVAGGGGAVGTVDQGAGGLSAWLVSVNGVPHVIIDSATIAALTDGSQRVGGTVAVTGPLTDTQLRATAVPVSIGAVVHVDDNGGSLTVDGTVAVSNFPATQPVSGTVAVSSVSGTVTVNGSGVTQPVSGAVSVSNFPATQPVSGTVAATQGTSPWVVDGSAVTQPVSGTFFQATQPVSVASLPLPDDAATETTLDKIRSILNDMEVRQLLADPVFG